MGAYRSSPIKDKVIEQGENDKLSFTVASMHGWRYNQEDRYRCQLNLQESVSMFGVFDGHGGPEVAEYIALHLHEFLASFDLNLENIENTLRDAFLQFDTRFRHDENSPEDYLAQLREIKKRCTPDSQLQNHPLQEIVKSLDNTLRKITGDTYIGPIVRVFCARRHRVKALAGQSSSHAVDVAPQPSTIGGNKRAATVRDSGLSDEDVPSAGDEEVIKKSKLDIENPEDPTGPGASATMGKGDVGAGASASSAKVEIASNLPEPSGKAEQSEKSEKTDEEGEAEDDPEDSDFDCAKAEEEDEELAEDFNFNIDKVNLGGHPTEEPGVDSGSTACIVFVYNKGDKNRLVVANIGDCRAVLCRNGKHFELSTDHKPDDETEKARIEAAGGTISDDGRIDTGLNLSRAFGDYFYKRNNEKPPDEQMVIAVPEVRIYDIEEGDSFVLVASDGIWNSMDSEVAVEFVKSRRDEGKEYSEIISEMMDSILADNTSGDGTGCDNMTMIVIDLKQEQSSVSESADK